MSMKCKHCGAEMAQWGVFCPVCGKTNEEETEAILTAETELLADNADLPEAEQELSEAPEAEEESETAAKTRKMKRNMAMVGCVALLAVLATVLFFGIRGGWDVSGWFDWLKPRENTIAYKDSYTVDDKKLEKKLDVVVATMDDMELTNAQLQIYYWSEVYDFLNNYYYYLSYIGFDYSSPLDEQVCYFDSTVTWQQYFLQSAIEVWQSNMAFARLAQENDFQMPEDFRAELDSMPEDLAEQAAENGYDHVNDMVAESFGAGVTIEDYVEYMETYYLGYLYFAELYEAIDPTLEEITEYFNANQEALEADGITQDGSYYVDVRHILVMIDTIAAEMEEDETTDTQTEETADGETTAGEEDDDGYTDAQWEACRQAAQDILDQYLAGEMTEEAFGELANQYSEDHAEGETVTNGGLYTYVAEGEMAEDFNSWCFTEGRQAGDIGLVKTVYGYHVMYFVGSEETWITEARSAYISEQSNELVAEALDRFTVEINYKKIALSNVEL